MSLDDATTLSRHGLSPQGERRATLRIDVLGQVEAHSVWRLRPLELCELSETGFSLRATGPFEAEVVHKFRIGIEGHRHSVIVNARLRHCRLDSLAGALPIYVNGFELVSAGDEARREIRSILRFADSMWQEALPLTRPGADRQS